jgi:N-acetylneuraminic acid mutarotase
MKNYLYVLILFFFVATSANAQWTPVASPPADFITDHTFGFALDGKGYLVTGTDQNGIIRDDFYEYDPVSDQFTQLDDFPGGARGFAIGDTWNGKAYFGFGNGASGTLGDLWEFDPTTESWTELASCPCTPRIHPAFIAHNDKIFVGLGGSTSGDLNDWWIYDIPTDTWTEGAGFPDLRRHHPYQFAIDEYVYVGFGHGGALIFNEWYRYDIATDEWEEMATLPAEGRVAGQQFSWNGKGYILSGEGEDHNAMEEGEFWSYDPELDAWEQMPSHPSTSRWAPATFVIDSEVYLFNGIVYGFGPAESVREAYKYNLAGEISSADDIGENAGLTIHPNPASDYLILENDDLNPIEQVTLYDLQGKRLMDFQLEGKNEIDVSSFESGVYLLGQEGKSGFTRVVIRR